MKICAITKVILHVDSLLMLLFFQFLIFSEFVLGKNVKRFLIIKTIFGFSSKIEDLIRTTVVTIDARLEIQLRCRNSMPSEATSASREKIYVGGSTGKFPAASGVGHATGKFADSGSPRKVARGQTKASAKVEAGDAGGIVSTTLDVTGRRENRHRRKHTQPRMAPTSHLITKQSKSALKIHPSVRRATNVDNELDWVRGGTPHRTY